MTTIAIVGAGFSGTLLALHLMRRCPTPTRVILIERFNQFGAGLAYSTDNPSHILNVPAGRMSAFQNQPDDFLNWLNRQEQPAASSRHSFVPRKVFGAYIQARLHEGIQPSGRHNLELIKGDVVGLGPGIPMTLRLDRDRVIQADFVILAIGNVPPEPVPAANPTFYATEMYCSNAWSAAFLTGLNPDAPVLLLGTGLTMIDATISRRTKVMGARFMRCHVAV